MSESYPMYIDRRDAPVVDQLETGETYRTPYIRRLYRTHTDITREDTADQRMRNLVDSPCFEFIRSGSFRFTGWSDD